jgi:2,4-dienoyl-CoA reductase (NADPH2)
MNNVQMIADVNYERIGDDGLLISFGDKRENPTWIDVDHVVLCAGQLPLCELQEPLQAAGLPTYVIGGADIAAELDAKRAIDQGSRLAATL